MTDFDYSRYERHTPGNWEWGAFGRTGLPTLRTPHSGQLIVMDAQRNGMHGAAFRFSDRNGSRDGGLMRTLILDEVRRHPDAILIADAPKLLARCKALEEENARLRSALLCASNRWESMGRAWRSLSPTRQQCEEYAADARAAVKGELSAASAPSALNGSGGGD